MVEHNVGKTTCGRLVRWWLIKKSISFKFAFCLQVIHGNGHNPVIKSLGDLIDHVTKT